MCHCPHVDKLENFLHPPPSSVLQRPHSKVQGAHPQRDNRIIVTFSSYGSSSIRGISVKEEMVITRIHRKTPPRSGIVSFSKMSTVPTNQREEENAKSHVSVNKQINQLLCTTLFAGKSHTQLIKYKLLGFNHAP